MSKKNKSRSKIAVPENHFSITLTDVTASNTALTKSIISHLWGAEEGDFSLKVFRSNENTDYKLKYLGLHIDAWSSGPFSSQLFAVECPTGSTFTQYKGATTAEALLYSAIGPPNEAIWERTELTRPINSMNIAASTWIVGHNIDLTSLIQKHYRTGIWGNSDPDEVNLTELWVCAYTCAAFSQEITLRTKVHVGYNEGREINALKTLNPNIRYSGQKLLK